MSKFKTLEENQMEHEALIKANERYQMILLAIGMLLIIGAMLLFVHQDDVANCL